MGKASSNFISERKKYAVGLSHHCLVIYHPHCPIQRSAFGYSGVYYLDEETGTV